MAKLTFGFQLASEGVQWREFLETWKKGEEFGYESGWSADHYVSTTSTLVTDPQTDFLDGWQTLGAIAQATKKIRLGPLVSGNTFRHPAILAKMGATLDHISNGRLEFGIGASWFKYEHDALGIAFPSPGERLKRLDEAVQIIKGLWTQREVTFQGAYYQLTKAPAMPKPIQKPHPPITIGAFGEKVALKIVARHADHWNSTATPERYASKAAALEAHCAAVGRDPKAIRRSVMIPFYPKETPEVKQWIEQRATMAKTSLEAAREWFLVGDKREIQDRMDRFAKQGVSLIIIQLQEHGRNIETMKAFGKMLL
ncbi:MAG: TIGR03560 family F420-dependent LLM class oxidoreductase [Chloroflexi bacterium]|nr:TIGR03560 family F420-dependent LLM class oxidoreductase [Chloroflexota bacterium]